MLTVCVNTEIIASTWDLQAVCDVAVMSVPDLSELHKLWSGKKENFWSEQMNQ